MFVKSCWYLMLFAARVAAAGPVCAQGTEAGRFLSVVGDVRVGREGAPQRAAQRAAEFYEGESIVTAAGALAQLRMTDGALMSVRGDTEIKLERFSYAGEQDRNASFLMSVLKGGLRTITGVIGRQNRERYGITTATVTIGVRGTDFAIVPLAPVVTGADKIMLTPVVDPANPGTTTTLTQVVTSTTTVDPTTVLSPITTTNTKSGSIWWHR